MKILNYSLSESSLRNDINIFSTIIPHDLRGDNNHGFRYPIDNVCRDS